MDIVERLTDELSRRGVNVVTGPRSRCHVSIACYTSSIAGRRPVVSVNPTITDPSRIAEALAVQLAMIDAGTTGGRYRLTPENYTGTGLARVWRRASRLSISDAAWNVAMAAHISGRDLEERFGVTARIVRTRWNLWMAQRGNAGPMLADPVDYSLAVRGDDAFWCDTV